MKIRIIVITSKFLHEFVQNILEQIQPDCIFEVVEYEDFRQISEIYQKYENKADGFMISGKAAQAAIQKAIPNHRKPMVSFYADTVGLYRMLLELFVQKRDLDTKRVIFDFLLPIHDNATVEFFLHDIKLPMLGTMIDEWLVDISMNEFECVEEQMAQRAVQLWDEGQIDLVICQYSSIIPVLEERGIPYRYPFPEVELVQSLVEELLQQIELKRMRENLPAVIAVAEFEEAQSQEQERKFKDALQSIKNEMMLGSIIQEDKNRYYIFTSLKMIDEITDEMRICRIQQTLVDKYDVSAAVGYGIGSNIAEAKGNAEDALKESLFTKKSFAVDEQHSLLGPLNAEQYMEVRQNISREIGEIAEQCKLSTLTIQKLYSIVKMMGTNKMTTQDLAQHMGVTVRNANRILSNLEKGGAATIVYTQSMTSKGRPIKVYELDIRE